jgi:glycosyltransferase involved in cell wall biosynthesis
MRLAWFSPLPPTHSGIAAYSAEVLPMLARSHDIDVFVERPSIGQSSVSGPQSAVDGRRSTTGAFEVHDAHEFIWRYTLNPYDLVVYQLGNAPCHDYMWAYLARYPGLVVLHDARLHHARAHWLLVCDRANDYRAEFLYDHPNAPENVVEYAVKGFGGDVTYLWPMLGVVLRTARSIVVHSAGVADELRADFPDAAVNVLRMGVASLPGGTAEARVRLRRDLEFPDDAIVFTTFGKVTAEKRIEPILRALKTVVAEGVNAYLLVVGDESEYGAWPAAQIGVSDRVRVTGYVKDEAIADWLGVADVALCLRWPTAEETSASWLRCLAAGRATVITDLPHLADLPTFDPLTWHPRHRTNSAPVAVSIDLLDEDASLAAAMRRLANDQQFRDELGRAGQLHWSSNHRLEHMAADYLIVIDDAAGRPAPQPGDLPSHFTNDYSGAARSIADAFGVQIDILKK